MVSRSDTVIGSDGDKKVTKSTTNRKSSRHATKEADLGNALRSVYQQTVAEQIPPEMLDLLGKLD